MSLLSAPTHSVVSRNASTVTLMRRSLWDGSRRSSLTVLKQETETLWQALVCLPLRKSIVFYTASYVGWLSWITG